MEDKGFKIQCMNCGYEECTIQSEYDYDWDEESYLTGVIEIICPKCGQCEMC